MGNQHESHQKRKSSPSLPSVNVPSAQDSQLRQDVVSPQANEASVRYVFALEVLCPVCQIAYIHSDSGISLFKADLAQKQVECPGCHEIYMIPLDSPYTPIDGEFHKTQEKKQLDRPPKKKRKKEERKSKAGRKTINGSVRQPLQLSLDPQTIDILNQWGINKSQLFERLLELYPPFREIKREIMDAKDLENNG